MADEAVLAVIDYFGDSFLEAAKSGLREGANCSAEETLTSKFLTVVEAAKKEFGVTFTSSLLFLCLRFAIRQCVERERNPVILRKVAFAERT